MEHTNLNHLSDLLNIELDKLSIWSASNKLTLNIDKSHFVIFHRARLKQNNVNISLNRVTFTKFLGVIIDDNSAYSGAQASNQQPVVNNDNNGQRINEALNSFLGYIKQLDQKMTHMEAQYNQCIQMQQNFWGPQQMRWIPSQMSHQTYNLA